MSNRIGAKVVTYDPFIKQISTKMGVFNSEKDAESALSGANCAIFLVDHDFFKEMDIDKWSKR